MAASDTRLDPAAIRRDAEQAAGLGDWDDTDAREPLELLTDALEAEAQLHDLGRTLVGDRLRNMLTGYIEVQGDALRCPAILQERVDAPVVLCGSGRAGSTMLHGLLAADPGHRAPVWWEALRPSPPPDPATFDTDPRRREVQGELDDILHRNPSLWASLAYSADLTAECNTITQVALRSQAFHVYYRTPTYKQWLLDADQAPLYRYHRRALQQLQWGWPDRRWVLKAPPHRFNLEQLVAEYPDAKLIQNHRDPKTGLASGCALQVALRRLYSDSVDPHEMGRDSLEMSVLGRDREAAFRAAHPEISIFDVQFEELVVDPLAMVERIYDWLGVSLTPEARAAMESWLVENARDKRPVEHHTLEEFGLTDEEVDERLGHDTATGG